MPTPEGLVFFWFWGFLCVCVCGFDFGCVCFVLFFFFNLPLFLFCAEERKVRNGKVNKIKYGNIAPVWRA